jgi:glycosyltransferase involved in cell wall biosynthesis
MRLAIISLMTGFPWGGSEELWYRVALLAKDRHSKLFVSVVDWEQHTSQKVNDLDGPDTVLYLRKNQKRSGFIQRLKSRVIKPKNALIEKLKSFNPDLVYINQGDTYSVTGYTPLIQYLVSEKVPYIIICQFNVEHGVLSEVDLTNARQIFGAARNVVFVSQRNKDVAERQLAQDIPNAKIIYNPIKLEMKEIIPFPKSERIVFASVARLDCNYKGQDLLLQVMAGKEWRQRDWQLNLYGSGPDRQYLSELIEYYQLREKVRLCGRVVDVARIWAESHMLLLPSIGEGTPLTLLEAMSCGRTALVTDAGGNLEFIIHGNNGFSVDAPTVKLIAQGMEEVWKNRNNLKALGEAAFLKVTEAFSEPPETTLLNLAVTNHYG